MHSEQRQATPEARRIRGVGRVYKRGEICWIRYSHRGRDVRESSRSTREVDAVRLLKKRLKEIGRGRFVGPAEERVILTDLLDALVVDYKINGRRSLSTLLGRLKPLQEAFGLDRAVDVTEDRIERYKADRLASLTHRESRSQRQPSTASWPLSGAPSVSR